MKFDRALQVSVACLFFLFTILIFTVERSSAASVTLAWNENTQSSMAGYKLYYHTCAAGDQKPVDPRNTNLKVIKLPLSNLQRISEPKYQVSNLSDTQNYAFAVTAYLTNGTESGFSNTVHFQTALASAPTTADPDVTIIDNGGSGTSYTGTWKTSNAVKPWNPSSQNPVSLWARGGSTYTWSFTPAITGSYQVAMWWTQYSSRSTSIPVSIAHSGGTATVKINQQTNGGKWNTLGTYTYKAGVRYAVKITSQADPTSTCADAVKFTSVSSTDRSTTSTSSVQSGTTDTAASTSQGADSSDSISSSAFPTMEIGEIAIDHQWTQVVLTKSFVDPIVVATPASLNNADPAVVRIRNVKAGSFEIRVQEWDYLDDRHPSETVGFIAMERGTYCLANGTRIEASTFKTDKTGVYQPVVFEQDYPSAPVVIGSVTSVNESDAVTGRIRNIDKDGFEYMMQEQEANARNHAAENIDYIAWQQSSGSSNGYTFEVYRTGNIVNRNFKKLIYKKPFSRSPIMVAGMQTCNGYDTANLRWKNKSASSVEIQVCEEGSLENEMDHATEAVGYILLTK